MNMQLAGCICTITIGAMGILVVSCGQERTAPSPLANSYCADCHGSAGDPAPPLGVYQSGARASQTSERSVGAHQAHLKKTTWSASSVECQACHIVPKAIEDPGHADSKLPAEVTFGGLAIKDGVQAQWNGDSCAVYCHGVSLSGGTNTNPKWTSVGAGQAACGSCHGLPPTAEHPSSNNCAPCHQGVASATAILKPQFHLNGIVETGSETAVDAGPGLDSGTW